MKLLTLLFFATVACAVPGFSQTPPAASTQPPAQGVTEPEYRDQYVAVVHGQLVPLERETAMTDTQNRRNFVITPSMRVFRSIPKPASPVRVPPNAHFLVKMDTGDRDPLTLIHLQPLKATKKDREVTTMTYKESLIPFGGVKHDRAADNTLAITVHKVGTGSLEIIPQAPLPPGEYAFINGYEAQCFGVDAGAAADPGVRPEATVVAQAPPPPPAPPPGWTSLDAPEITSTGQDVMQTTAKLLGKANIHGQQVDAFLYMHCGFPATEYPGSLPLEVVLGGTDSMFDVPAMPGTWVDISDFAASRLGKDAPLPVNAVAQNRTTGARVRFFYDAADMQRIVDSPGQPLHLVLNAGPAAGPPITATFQLPAENTALQKRMQSCLTASAAQAAAVQTRTVATCPPPKENTILDSVELKYAATGRPVPGDSDEEDFGETWKLSPAAKGHPAHKIAMTCSYRQAGTGEGQAVSEKTTVPVPAIARYCDFVVHKNTLHNAAACLSVPSREAALRTAGQPGLVTGGGAKTGRGQIGTRERNQANANTSASDVPAD